MSGKATAYSSHGQFTFDTETGVVLSTARLDPSFGTMPTRVDLEEFGDYYGCRIRNRGSLDVMAISFWTADEYVDAMDNDWRQTCKEDLANDIRRDIRCGGKPLTDDEGRLRDAAKMKRVTKEHA